MKRGDLIKLNLDPQAGHEQAGWRPALVLSVEDYNRYGLAIIVPITSQVKGYEFERALPEGLAVTGVILVDHVKNVDWRARKAKIVGEVPRSFVIEIAREVAEMIITDED